MARASAFEDDGFTKAEAEKVRLGDEE